MDGGAGEGVGSAGKETGRRAFLARYFVLDAREAPLGCEWLGNVAVRHREYWAEVEGWHARTWATKGWVKPFRGPRVGKRTVNWRERPSRGRPVWGWRARIVAWSTLTGGGLSQGQLVGVGQWPNGEHRLGRQVCRDLRAVARGERPWTVELEGRCRLAIAVARDGTVRYREARRPGRLRLGFGPGGPVIQR